jgi:hypothetical protein
VKRKQSFGKARQQILKKKAGLYAKPGSESEHKKQRIGDRNQWFGNIVSEKNNRGEKS